MGRASARKNADFVVLWDFRYRLDSNFFAKALFNCKDCWTKSSNWSYWIKLEFFQVVLPEVEFCQCSCKSDEVLSGSCNNAVLILSEIQSKVRKRTYPTSSVYKLLVDVPISQLPCLRGVFAPNSLGLRMGLAGRLQVLIEMTNTRIKPNFLHVS